MKVTNIVTMKVTDKNHERNAYFSNIHAASQIIDDRRSFSDNRWVTLFFVKIVFKSGFRTEIQFVTVHTT
jgi:hypothetical protein